MLCICCLYVVYIVDILFVCLLLCKHVDYWFVVCLQLSVAAHCLFILYVCSKSYVALICVLFVLGLGPPFFGRFRAASGHTGSSQKRRDSPVRKRSREGIRKGKEVLSVHDLHARGGGHLPDVANTYSNSSEFSKQNASITGWHYLSNATCLIRHHLLHVLFVASRIIIICYTIRHF